jgi:hypothetical protein
VDESGTIRNCKTLKSGHEPREEARYQHERSDLPSVVNKFDFVGFTFPILMFMFETFYGNSIIFSLAFRVAELALSAYQYIVKIP